MRMSSFVTVFSLVAFLTSHASEYNERMSPERYKQIAPLVEQYLISKVTSDGLSKAVVRRFLPAIISFGVCSMLLHNTNCSANYYALLAGECLLIDYIYHKKAYRRLIDDNIMRYEYSFPGFPQHDLFAFLSKHNISQLEFYDVLNDKNVEENVINRLKKDHPILWRLY